MTHKLEMLTSMVLTKQEREMEEDIEIVKQARLIEDLGRSQGDFRPLCIRSRYATTDSRVQSQPWVVFSNTDTAMASRVTKVILKYCADNIKQADILSNCVIN